MALWEFLAGLALILVALTDIFETLFHPSGRGRGSEFISRHIWRSARRFCAPSHRILSLIGPINFVLIVLAWMTLLVVGFALIYSPDMYSGFVLAPGLSKARHHGFSDAINVSLGSLITIGGDFNADSKWLRLP